MTSYEMRMAAMGDSGSDSDYLEMKPYVKPKHEVTAAKKKKKQQQQQHSTPKSVPKTTVTKKASSRSPANKRKRASNSFIKEEADITQSEDFGLSELFATPNYSQAQAHNVQLSCDPYGNPATSMSVSQDIFSQGQGLETVRNDSAIPYNPFFGNEFGNEYFQQTNISGTSHSYAAEADYPVFDEDRVEIDGETEQVGNTVSPFENDSSRYEGSDSEDEHPRKAAKLNKDGVPRKPRRPRPKLLKWSDDDWKNVILGIVWACGETGVQIPFQQAAQVVGEHCTAGALQQALLKLRGKQIAEGYQIPSLKMAWTRKNRNVSSSSSANSKSAQELDAGKALPRKQPTRVEGTQSRLVILRRSYSDLDRQGIPFPCKWKKPRQSTALDEPWKHTDANQDEPIHQPLSTSDAPHVPDHASGAELSVPPQMPNPNNAYAHAMQTQPSAQSIQGRRQQNHRNGKVSSGSGELTLNPAASVHGQTATFHNHLDTEDQLMVGSSSGTPATTSGAASTLQYSEETLGLLEGRGPATNVFSELRTDFSFPERPNNLGQSFTGMNVAPPVPATRSIAARRQGHRRSAAIFPGALFEAGTLNNANHASNGAGDEEIKYSDIVANTTLIHTPNTLNRFAQVYSPGYLDNSSRWYPQSPSTPDNTVAANNHVSFSLSSSDRIDGAFNPQGNHTVDLNGGMNMARASYEHLLTVNDTEGLSNGFADLADDIFD